ncbi:hypothetical protein AYO38_10935 [bacterium SCGC AG-212-C10]|nr:hypothetical protein AYO38_10935 [bacterium SCGC AG-212-C10]
MTDPRTSADDPFRVTEAFLQQSYDAFATIEETLNERLDASLQPRGPSLLFDIVGELGLPPGAMAIDAGCGEGEHALELARRFRLNVLGVDPVARHIEIAQAGLNTVTVAEEDSQSLVRFQLGTVEHLPAGDQSADLIWCRDVLTHVSDQAAVFAEFRRVLKTGGHALIYQMFATELLEPKEAAWLLPVMGCVASSMRVDRCEEAIHAAGLAIDRCIVLGTEWGEYGQEANGKAGRKLLHAGRLLRDPERYVREFGQANYDIALGDCLWHVYRLIGKLSDRIYVLSAHAHGASEG